MLTDDFIDKTIKFRKSVDDADLNNPKLEDKLDKILGHFKAFFNVEKDKPDEIFLGVTTEISSMIGKDSVMNKDLLEKQSNLFSVADSVQSVFKKERKSKTAFEYKSPEEKMEIDKKVLSVCEDIYKEIIIEDPDASLRKNEQERLAGIIMNFCDSFYDTNKDGSTIYGIDIKSLKTK